MNIKQLSICLLFIAGLLPIACSPNEEQPEEIFKGTDNYVISFGLTKDGIGFHATVTPDEIILSIPENISVNNATPEIVLSEKATIYPEPNEISDWDNERMFVVTSFDGTERTYRYSIARTGKAYNGSIALNTQAEVNEFAKHGYNAIYGSLIIGNVEKNDKITSLDGLGSLQDIYSFLTIGPAFGGANLDGLDNLASIGSLCISESNDSINGLSLPKLERITADANIVNNHLFSVSLPRLKYIGGSLTLQVSAGNLDISALQEINGTFRYILPKESILTTLSLQSLKKISGDFSISAIVQNNPGKLSIINLPELQECSSFKIGKISTLTTLYAPELTTIVNEFNTGQNNFLELQIPSVKKVGIWTVLSLKDTLDISGCDVGKLIIKQTAMNGTDEKIVIADETFKGDIEIERIYSDVGPITLKGFSQINSLTTENNGRPMDLSMPDTKIVTGNINLSSYSRFKHIIFPLLEEVGGDLNTGRIHALDDETVEMPFLRKVGGNLIIDVYIASITSIALPSLETVGKDLELGVFTNVKNIDFSSLTSIGGTLSIIPVPSASNFNTELENLDGFKYLESVGAVCIQKNTALFSFKGIEKTFPCLSEDNWTAQENGYNPTYDDLKAGKWEITNN